MNKQTVQATSCYSATGKKITEGKTKIIWESLDDATRVILEAKDDITAFNKAKHDQLTGKKEYATRTTCNVFRLLKEAGVPVAFDKQLDTTRFQAPKCDMVLYEVVARREAHGSFLKRHPELKKETLFPQLKIEFFLKTTDKNWKGTVLPEDDPFVTFNNNKADLYIPSKPFYTQEPFLQLNEYPLKDAADQFKVMETLTKQTFLVLEKAWQMTGKKLVDFKLEFGFDMQGNLLVADVIDNDSWRVLQAGHYLDKQAYRDGASLDEVTKKYQLVADLTDTFHIPEQQIILWRGSDKDDFSEFHAELENYAHPKLKVTEITCSIHKEPVAGILALNKAVQATPNSVVVAFIGRSNGAGPTLSANTHVPVITVPGSWKKLSEDVWSSLNTPSKTPVLTALYPNNAILSALEILALNNPYLYMKIRSEQEQRFMNVVTL